jgi:S1-C subfamily serine protease
VALAVALLMALPVLGTAAPALAAPAPHVRPVVAPSSDLLTTLGNLLARLLQSPPPPASPGVAPSFAAGVVASTVRVNATACGVHLAGSGFSAAPGTIVTNAHVVAGASATSVLRPDGTTLPATVSAFDPKRDLAVLTVAGLGEPALPVASAVVGETDAIFGHSLGHAAVDVIPARITRRVTADIGDIYGQPGATRQLLVMSSVLAPGDSGAPVVDAAGKVVGVAFGSSVRNPSIAYAVASEELAPVLAQPRTGPVSTGPCLDEG